MAAPAAAFAQALAQAGGFESRPRLAVAVSGGGDSLALLALAQDWAEARGGEAVALTVDHGTGEGAAGRARLAEFAGARGIAWTALCPLVAAPTGAGHERAARTGRYAALAAYCRQAGILHLLAGHTADDQAETVLLRLAAGSGPDGLAAMPLVRPCEGVRLIRPLLAVGRQELRACLADWDIAWADAPGNASARRARGRLRAAWPALAREGLATGRLAALAAQAGRDRDDADRRVAAAAARGLVLAPTGVAWLDRAALAGPAAVAERLLGRAVRLADGRGRSPPAGALARARTALLAGQGRSLGGAVLRPAAGWVVVYRAPGRFTATATVPGDGRPVALDGRLRLWRRWPGPPLAVQALTPALWAALRRRQPALDAALPPGAARYALAVALAAGDPVALAGLDPAGDSPLGCAPVAGPPVAPGFVTAP